MFRRTHKNRVRALERALEKRARKGTRADAPGSVPVLYDPKEPGVWVKLLGAVRELRKKGAHYHYVEIVDPPEVDCPDISRRRPYPAPVDVSPQPTEKPPPEETDEFSHFRHWSIDALQFHARGKLPGRERLALEDALNDKLRQLRGLPPLTSERKH